MKKMLLMALLTTPLLFACGGTGNSGTTGGSQPSTPPAPVVTEPAQVPGHLDIIYLIDPATPPVTVAAIRRAEAYLESVITSPLSAFEHVASSCDVSNYRDPRGDTALVISVNYNLPAGNPLGTGGPCDVDARNLPHSGQIRLAANAHTFNPSVQEALILHETLHVMGIGILWKPNASARITTPEALKTYQALGGSAQGVPTTSDGSHWMNTVMNGEVMISGLDADLNTVQPVSSVTLGTLKDMGWPVDLSKAMPYTLGIKGQALPNLRPVNLEGDTSHTHD